MNLGTSLDGTENLAPLGFDSRAVQPVASRYTDYAVRASKKSHTKVKSKVHPITGHKGPEVDYSSTLSLNSALDGVGGQRHAPAALAPGKTWYPLCRRLGGPQSRSGRVRKISPPPGFDPRTVQPVASRYTD